MIGFVAAERREFSGLQRHLTKEENARLHVQWAVFGNLNGQSVVLASNGPGPLLVRRAAEKIGERAALTALVSYGFCGALDPALSLYDVVTWGRHLACPPENSPRAATPLSIDKVITTAQGKKKLREQTAADVVEMEAAGVLSYARDHQIPFYAVRVVTDTATEDLAMDFNLTRDRQGRFSRSRILAQAFRRPSLFPKLMDLDRRTKIASAVLGDFVAGCQF